jgi:hypothetical protein
MVFSTLGAHLAKRISKWVQITDLTYLKNFTTWLQDSFFSTEILINELDWTHAISYHPSDS